MAHHFVTTFPVASLWPSKREIKLNHHVANEKASIPDLTQGQMQSQVVFIVIRNLLEGGILTEIVTVVWPLR